MLDPARIDEVRAVVREGDAFYSHPNREVFASVVALADESDKVDIVTISNHLRARHKLEAVGGPPYLAQLIDATPHVSNVVEHARIVADKWRLRQCIAQAQEIAAEGYGDSADVQALVERATDQFGQLAFDPQSADVHHVSDLLRHSLDELDRRKQQPSRVLAGLTTGLTDLDLTTSGWMVGLHVVAGRPGMGKTSLGLCSAIEGSRPKNDATVCFFSMEMPKEQIAERIIAAEARVDLAKLRTEALRSGDWGAVVSAVANVSAHNLWIDDTPAMAVAEVRSKVRKVRALAKSRGLPEVRAVFVDYLQLMSATSRAFDRRTREQEVSEVSKALKRLAMVENLAVVALAQLNRDVEKRTGRRPQLSDLRESGSIEQEADSVIFVHRAEQYEHNPPEEIRGIATIIVAKQRNGPLGETEARFTARSSRFDNLVKAYDDTEQFDIYDPGG